MSITRTVVCRGKNHCVQASDKQGAAEYNAYFSAPDPEGSGQIGGSDVPVPLRDHVHTEGLTAEEWNALTPGQTYTLTIS